MKTFAQQLDECIEYAFAHSHDAGIERFVVILLRSSNTSAARGRYIAEELARREARKTASDCGRASLTDGEEDFGRIRVG